jgi:iron complex outermembrane receptor protein
MMICSLLLAVMIARAQTDTVRLDEIRISAVPMSDYATSATVRTVDLDMPARSVDQLLEHQPSVYFRTYGHGQLASISFRGTSPSQTSVLWHGIPVNSPNLGQTDFSTWPAWLLDDLALAPGGGSALYGSGAIGGTVFIDSFDKARASSENRLSAKLAQGSFGYWMAGLRGDFRAGSWSGSTRLMFSDLANDFDIPVPGTDTTRTQNNAAVRNYGLKQTLQYADDQQRISLDLLYTNNDRQIQPTISNRSSTDQLQTEAFRIAAEHILFADRGTLSTTVAFSKDRTDYNEGQITESTMYSALSRWEQDLTEQLSFQTGLLVQYSQTQSDNFEGRPDQLQVEPFASVKWQPFKAFVANATVRASLIDGSWVPVTPSIGARWSLVEEDSRQWGLKARASRAYRVPTLNDRFWQPGGNPELRAENSMHAEAGLFFSENTSDRVVKAELSLYQTWSDNWIIWIPGESGIFSPTNLRKVVAQGIETSIEYDQQWANVRYKASLTGSYTKSTLVEDPFDPRQEGNQLAYVPEWLGSLRQRLAMDSWRLFVNSDYTGQRFSTLDNSELLAVDDFLLVDVGGGRTFERESASFELSFLVKNVTDTYYENLINRAMPGINYQIELLINLKL